MAEGTAGNLPAAKPRLGLGTKLAYGVGSAAYGIKDHGFNYLLLSFYSIGLGVDASTVGLALLLALIFDAFSDPVIGYLSDNTRTRWGRRHPYMYAAAAPIALVYLFLWNPAGHDQRGRVLLLSCVTCHPRSSADHAL